MRKQDVRSLFVQRAGRWPTLITPGPRGDNPPPPPPASGGAAEPPAGPNLADPAIQAAIQAATQKALQTATQSWEQEKAAILGNKEQILSEKKAWDAFGKPDEVAARLKRLEEIEAKDKAGEHGRSGEEWLAAVEAEAQKKHQLWRTEQAALLEKDRTRIQELEKTLAETKAAEHRAWCSYRIALAAMPEDYRYIQSGAEDMLMDRLVGLMERYEADGVPAIARFKVGGTLMTGSGPGGYMTEREFLDMARAGKLTGVPQLQYLFVSNGQGSNTTTPNANIPAAGGNWWKMSEDDRTTYIKKHGAAAAKELMDSSPREKAA